MNTQNPFSERLLNGLLILGFLFLPLFFSKQAEVTHEVPKVFLFQKWAEILGIVALISAPTFLKKDSLNFKLILLVLLFGFWALISSLLGVNFGKSIVGNFFRADGIVTLFHLLLLFFTLVLFLEKGSISTILKTLSLSSFILSLLTLIDCFRFFVLKHQGVNVWEGQSFGGPFGNPNFLAGYILPILPLTYFQIVDSKDIKKIFLIIGFIFQVIAIIMTKTWSGLFGIVILLGIYLIRKTQRFQKLFIMLSLVSLLILITSYTRHHRSIQIPGRIIAESRERIFVKGLLAFTQKPITGWGWANFDVAFQSSDWPIKFEIDAHVDKAHSSFLEVLVTTGLVGFIFYLFIIILTFLNLYKQKNPMAKTVFVSFLITVVHMQTNVISISEEILFWSLVSFSTKRL